MAFDPIMFRVAGVPGPELLWDQDWRTYDDADWLGAGATTLGGLSVTLTNSDPTVPTAWGPDSNLGVRVVRTGANDGWGRIGVDWLDIGTDLMNRALTRDDLLIFTSQHAVASWSIATQGSKVVMEVYGTGGANSSAWCPLDRIGGNNRSFRWWQGGGVNTTFSDNTQIRTGALVVQTGRASGYSSNTVLDGDTIIPFAGYGPVGFIAQGEIVGGFNYEVTDSKWDFEAPAGAMWWMLNDANGEAADIILERSQIWLLPGTPNV